MYLIGNISSQRSDVGTPVIEFKVMCLETNKVSSTYRMVAWWDGVASILEYNDSEKVVANNNQQNVHS